MPIYFFNQPNALDNQESRSKIEQMLNCLNDELMDWQGSLSFVLDSMDYWESEMDDIYLVYDSNYGIALTDESLFNRSFRDTGVPFVLLTSNKKTGIESIHYELFKILVCGKQQLESRKKKYIHKKYR